MTEESLPAFPSPHQQSVMERSLSVSEALSVHEQGGLNLDDWELITSRLEGARDPVAQRIAEYVLAQQMGRRNGIGFDTRPHFGRRHWERIMKEFPDARQLEWETKDRGYLTKYALKQKSNIFLYAAIEGALTYSLEDLQYDTQTPDGASSLLSKEEYELLKQRADTDPTGALSALRKAYIQQHTPWPEVTLRNAWGEKRTADPLIAKTIREAFAAHYEGTEPFIYLGKPSRKEIIATPMFVGPDGKYASPDARFQRRLIPGEPSETVTVSQLLTEELTLTMPGMKAPLDSKSYYPQRAIPLVAVRLHEQPLV